MDTARLHPIREYIRRRQAKIEYKLACLPIYELCAEAEWMPGKIRMMIWWNQEVVNESEDYTEILSNLS